ncbi:hypothetical protein EVC62_01975 [Salinicola endophyticus]|uniref:Uncharacterized protein n=1 Tax=Salinicola endophyticus TaxID=1949083 RepID=A0ABY8FIJ3_9GAMM|nr:hypothetical protein [Salinicola endophyticus]WFF40361.1 hypothetical protein EVC62_01975 [Salinicola endophyticus]
MQQTILNAHRLIGETLREPGRERLGRIVGVDQARRVPLVFVLWQGQQGIQRIELSVDDLRQLVASCERRYATANPATDAAGSATSDTYRDAEVAPRRRAGLR